jgi:hypothetical protein
MIRLIPKGDNTRKSPACHRISAAIPPISIAGPAMETAMTKFLIGLALATALALPAVARTPLNQNAHITDSLVAGRVGDTIRQTCPSISAKLVTAYSKLKELERYARDQGYTEDEVKVFMKDKAEKARIKVLAAEYLTKAGAVEGDAESFCKVGRDEIAKGTLAGSLLRSWK